MPTETDVQLASRVGVVEGRVGDLGTRIEALERRVVLLAFVGSLLGGGSVDGIARVRAALDAVDAPTTAAP